MPQPVDAGYGWLAVVGIINSVLSLAVYLRAVVVMYWKPGPAPATLRPALLVAGLALVLTLAVGLRAQALLAGVA